MTYKRHNIQVAGYPDLNGRTFHATYTIREGVSTIATRTVASGLKDLFDAESSADAGVPLD